MVAALYFGAALVLGGLWLAGHPRSALAVANHVRGFAYGRLSHRATRWSGLGVTAAGLLLLLLAALLA